MNEIEEIRSGSESDPDYEEGLDEDYDTEDDEVYQPELDIEDDEGEDDDEEQSQQVQQYIQGLGPLGPRGPRQEGANSEDKDGSKPWQGLSRLPGATKAQYVELLKRLKDLQKEELTILLLGKHYSGKSHTVNSLLNEEAAKKQFLNRDPTPAVVHSREAHGLKLNLIDAGAPTDLDRFSAQRMREVVKQVEKRPVDAVLYVDRFDVFRTDGTDEQVINGITQHLGPSIWNNAIICLTRASSATNGLSFDDFAEKRSSKVREVIRKFGGNSSASLPAAFVENDEACEQNSEGEHVLPNKKPWLPELMQKIVEVAESTKPYNYDSSSIEKSTNPNKQLRWLVPIVFIAQIAIKKFVLDPLLKDDYNTGDRNGPFEPSVVKGRRAIAQLEKGGNLRKGANKKQLGRSSRSRKVQVYDSDSD